MRLTYNGIGSTVLAYINKLKKDKEHDDPLELVGPETIARFLSECPSDLSDDLVVLRGGEVFQSLAQKTIDREELMHDALKLREKTNSSHRRLAIIGDDWVYFQDKNWAPFLWDNSIMFMYMADPPIFCQLESVDNKRAHSDCLKCTEFMSSEPTSIVEALKASVTATVEKEARTYLPKVATHLNGVPFLRLPNEAGFEGTYLGILHIKSMNIKWDAAGQHREEKLTYPHYFVRMLADPPFTLLDLSAEIPLEFAYPVGPWFGSNR